VVEVEGLSPPPPSSTFAPNAEKEKGPGDIAGVYLFGGINMRLTGTSVFGIRLPVIGSGDDLVGIVADHVLGFIESEGNKLLPDDIVAVTEGMVAKSERNFADIADIAADVREKFPDGEIGLVYPMLSRNRFYNILKGIAGGADKIYILLSYPQDEVGNPVMEIEKLDEITDRFAGRMVTAEEFRAVAGKYKLPFTGVDYVELYQNVKNNISIYFSNDPRDILKLTDNILVGEIHNRFRTRQRLLKAGAKAVFTLSDILNKSVNGSGFNSRYGVLGSNLSTGTTLKLFPDDAEGFVTRLKKHFIDKTGLSPEILVYGDGAFKDPVHGIWELADPVVSPGYTGSPRKLK
jgi:hypothetical protein